MTYALTFVKSAKKEWDKLNPVLQKQFKKKLESILPEPHIPKNKLAGMPDCYKIKLRSSGYRLVYRIIETRIVVQIIAIGKRDKNAIYDIARHRLN